jgi:Tol biopolymer transport system component
LSGGSPQALCAVAFGRGGSWSANNEIIFAPTGLSPIFRVSATGGTPQQVTTLNTARGDVSNRWPLFLPDGNHFVYLIRTPSKNGEAGEKINVASLDSPDPRPLMSASSNIVYVDPGYLLYMRDRTLVTQRFNTRSLQLEGDPRVITTEPMQYHGVGFGLFSASRSGVLAFGAGALSGNLEFFDRAGHVEPAIQNAANYMGPRFSPDGQQILYAVPDSVTGMLDLWLYDISRRVSRRITFHPRDDFAGAITPDGTQLIFSSNRLGFPSLFMKPIDGSEEKSLISPGSVPEFAEDISPDGRVLLFRRISAEMQNDIFAMTLSNKTQVPFAATQFNEVQPIFSPTGRWVAYVSNESGRYQVYVARYPAGGARVQITADGGMQPTWRADEKELFFLAPGGRMMSIPIDTTGDVVKPGVPVHLFDVSVRPSRDEEREYDVSRDGKRFIVNTAPPNMRSIPITVVVNWQSDLEHK